MSNTTFGLQTIRNEDRTWKKTHECSGFTKRGRDGEDAVSSDGLLNSIGSQVLGADAECVQLLVGFAAWY